VNRLLQLALAVTVGSVASVATVTAQSARFGLGGGLVAPMSDYKTTDKTGWHVFGKVDIGIPLSPVGVRVDAMYGQTSYQSPLTGNTKLAGGTADLVWKIPTAVPGFKPYVVGGLGLYNVNRGGGSATKFAWGGGLGTSIGVGPIHGFAEARYISIQLGGGSLKFIPLTVGLSFGS
jgi:hypothetical protein